MFFNFYFIILMIRIFSDCKISYTFPIHKTLAEFFFRIGRKCNFYLLRSRYVINALHIIIYSTWCFLLGFVFFYFFENDNIRPNKNGIASFVGYFVCGSLSIQI